jgi:curved DNA-binding protein CbpA
LNDSLYERLEVSPRARAAVIKAAYRCLVQQYHPDKKSARTNSADVNQNGIRIDTQIDTKSDIQSDSHEHMTLINHAYAVLCDPVLRAQYDRTLPLDGQTDRRGQRASKPSAPHSDATPKPKLRPFAFRPFE